MGYEAFYALDGCCPSLLKTNMDNISSYYFRAGLYKTLAHGDEVKSDM
jgi:hypothetical protein